MNDTIDINHTIAVIDADFYGNTLLSFYTEDSLDDSGFTDKKKSVELEYEYDGEIWHTTSLSSFDRDTTEATMKAADDKLRAKFGLKLGIVRFSVGGYLFYRLERM